ncbi:class I SAM-dependent methyltransferase [Aestuariivivens sediminicola]|uniref:class I SAM-dependent methyltransferase n=1 Tax=Aestuariivivens sediminicola TaxID=2913560 RepID=UPI001F5808E8|nr:class I SAM-dependent methyltransferase [Aestuariivivens sediminicola]
MGIYNTYVLPRLVDWACRQKPAQKQREKIIPLAHGKVLEIGIGSGLNLPFYNQNNINHLTAIDPSPDIWNQNTIDTKKLPFDFDFICASTNAIPAYNNSMDCVVMTYTLCSITNVSKAFEEIRRVLKPSGVFLFCEHGKAPDPAVRKWQNIINPIWKRLGGGCTLNKDIPAIIKSNGLKLSKMDTMYIPGWKPASFNYWGQAEMY